MLEYHVSTWVLEVKTISIFLMLKIQGFNLKYLVEVHGFEGTEYMVSSLGYRVHGFKATGYIVSRVQGT